MKRLGLIGLCLLLVWGLKFNIKAYMVMVVACFMANMGLHLLGYLLKEAYIEDGESLLDVCVMCFIPVFNGLVAIVIVLSVIFSPNPRSIKKLIHEIKP